MRIDPSTSKGLFTWTLLGAIVIIILWGLSLAILLGIFGEFKDAGTFGDSFGAINALFSGLAFLGVIVAIILQRQELIEQRLEIRNSRIAQEASAKALMQTLDDARMRTELESLNMLIQSYSTLVESTRLATTLKEKKRHEEARKQLETYKTLLFEKVNAIIKTDG